ncbi:MAG: hypothetical protein ABL973_03850 [Micropepsaceae bacterium]
MELFGFLGLGNATILTGAAAAIATGALVSVVSNVLRPLSRSSKLEGRVQSLEVRLAAASTYQPVLQMADEVLNAVSSQATDHVVEMFEAAATTRSFFTRRQDPTEIAAAIAIDLHDNIQLAASIARPIQSMLDNGSIEVVPERARLTADAKDMAKQLGSTSWDKYSASLLTGASMPSTTASQVVDCFTQVAKLKSAVSSLPRKPTANALIDVLDQSVSVIQAAARATDLFRPQGEPQPLKALPAPDESVAAE